MKKIYLLLPLVFTAFVNAQTTQDVQNHLEIQKNVILQKQRTLKTPSVITLNHAEEKVIKEYLATKGIQLSPQQYVEQQNSLQNKTLSGFLGNVPVYDQLHDLKANKAANVDFLYNGLIEGQGAPITGNGINITIVDGGSIIPHQEFNNIPNRIELVDFSENIEGSTSTVTYHSHALNVSGIMGASGIDAAAKGVLAESKFKSYSFNTTQESGNYFEKTFASDYKLSNHSYGVNTGWAMDIYSLLLGIISYPLPIEPLTDATKTYSGTYYSSDYNWDYIVDADPSHIIVKAAGNSFGESVATITSSPRSFIGIDVDGNQYEKAIGTVNDSVTITLASLPSGNCEGNKPCIDYGSLAKNIITVGAIEQYIDANDNRYVGPNQVQYANYSSAGPRKDGAIKPDIAAVGSNHRVANGTNPNTINSYGTNSGTSFSSPMVTGVIGALTRLQRNLLNDETFGFRGDEAKNLITHTADESGLFPGPDVFAGWGVINAKTAAEILIDVNNEEAIFETFEFENGTTRTYEVYGKADTPLKASISWIDPAADFVPDTETFWTDFVNDTSNKLVNDFDLRIIDTETNEVYFPWKLDPNAPRAAALKGDNTVDNVEQVLLENPVADRRYVVQISHKGNLVNHERAIENRFINVLVTGYNVAPLSTSDVNNTQVSVYPTKTKGAITIANAESKALVEVYSMNGQKVKTEKLSSTNQIDLSNLAQGIYIIKVKSEGKEISKKIVKY